MMVQPMVVPGAVGGAAAHPLTVMAVGTPAICALVGLWLGV